MTKRMLLLLRTLPFQLVLLLPLLLIAPTTGAAFLNDFARKLSEDYASLTRRVTARHILLPSEEPTSALKRRIREECLSQERYVVDVFEEAAQKYSRDSTTNSRGGLIGELVPQGYCRSPQLDRLCFEVTLGEVAGSVQTDYGWHLLLVSERTNCPKLDGDKTKLIQMRGDNVFGTLVPSKQVGSVNLIDLLVQQVGYWFFCLLAGAFVAELAEKLVTSL